jgi:outer membrane biosynthesis protein TonB
MVSIDSMFRMAHRFLPLIFIVGFCVHGHVAAQSGPDTKCQGVRSAQRINTSRLFSFGVLNARALKLVQPDYPKVARAVLVRGDVEISVVINENGCVIKADARRGHPLLTPASLRAARASVFEPVVIGRKRVKVLGTIVYKYRFS